MPIDNSIGHSECTIDKQQGLTAYLRLHMKIVTNVFTKNAHWLGNNAVYHYWDVTAGSGANQKEGVPGSPLIFLATIKRSNLRYHAHFIEREKDNVIALRKAIFHRWSTEDIQSVYEGNHNDLMPALLRDIDPKKSYGLVYMDMNGIPNFPLFFPISNSHPKLDFLIRCPATAIKRKRCQSSDNDMDLKKTINLMNKEVCLIREPLREQWQWTFLFFTNYSDWSGWEHQRFYRTDSFRGGPILERMNYTQQEIDIMNQPRLDLENEIEQRSGGICEVCHGRPATEKHHWEYGLPFVAEKQIDVCHTCHCLLEGTNS